MNDERGLEIVQWLKDSGYDPSVFNVLVVFDYAIRILGIIAVITLIICAACEFVQNRKFETKFDKRVFELEKNFITLSTRVKNLENINDKNSRF